MIKRKAKASDCQPVRLSDYSLGTQLVKLLGSLDRKEKFGIKKQSSKSVSIYISLKSGTLINTAKFNDAH